jgi:hypothetical protein
MQPQARSRQLGVAHRDRGTAEAAPGQ